jgi:hypothetical protein
MGVCAYVQNEICPKPATPAYPYSTRRVHTVYMAHIRVQEPLGAQIGRR